MKIYDNFLSKKDCKEIIKFHKEWFARELPSQVKKYHNQTEILNIEGLMCWSKVLRQFYSKLIETIRKYNKKLYISHSEIVRWPTNVEQEAHYDFDFNPYTCIMYLNHDYEGGQTFIKKELIQPKTGRMILFKGNKIKHGVCKITKGVRYTIPVWWDSL